MGNGPNTRDEGEEWGTVGWKVGLALLGAILIKPSDSSETLVCVVPHMSQTLTSGSFAHSSRVYSVLT